MSSRVTCLLALILVIPNSNASTARIQKSAPVEIQNTKAVLKYLSNQYDRHSAPINTSTPLQMKVKLVVESFDSIEETTMGFSLYVYLVHKWFDYRLKNVANVTTVLTGKDIEFIWTPDTYCLNARQSDLMMPDEQSHSMIRLDKTGLIVYSRGSYLKTSCVMDLRNFPMDKQRCSLKFASYGYSTKYAVYKWENPKVILPDPIPELAQFVLVNTMVSSYNSCYYSGNFTILSATFQFERRVGYYLLQIYVPCSFLVMLSWIAFWMDKRDTGNRLTVGVTTILTIMFLLGYSNSSVPKMSYVKAMDIYLLSSFALIFFSLVETVLCWRFDNGPLDKETNKESVKMPSNHSVSNNESSTGNEGTMHQRGNSKWPRKENCGPTPSSNSEIDEFILQKIGRCLDKLQAANQDGNTARTAKSKKRPRVPLDKLARFIFPLVYILFNIIYWSFWLAPQ